MSLVTELAKIGLTSQSCIQLSSVSFGHIGQPLPAIPFDHNEAAQVASAVDRQRSKRRLFASCGAPT